MLLRLIILLLLIPVSSWAAPSITGTSGTLTNGQTITISGTSFGTKTTAMPTISSYDHSTTANNWSGGSISGGWGQVASGVDPVTLTTGTPRATYYQSAHKGTFNSAGEYSAVYGTMNTPEDKIYVSWWNYRNYSSFSSGNNTKWFRVYQSVAPGESTGNICFSHCEDNNQVNNGDEFLTTEFAPSGTWNLSSYVSGVSKGATGWFGVDLSPTVGPHLQTWEHWEVFFDYPTTTAGNDGQVIVWKNGRRLFNATGVTFADGASDNTGRLIAIGQVSGGLTGTEWFDQIYMDKTIAHVFVSNSGTVAWPEQTTEHHSEIQVPSAWSASSITFTLNQGTCTNFTSDCKYLYVVDSTGAISNAYDLSSGGGGGGSTPSTVSGCAISGGKVQ